MKKSRKNWLKFTAAILTMAGTVSALAACNQETEQPGPGPGTDPVEETTTVSLIYDGMGVSMDFDGMLKTEADELAQETYGSADVKSYGVEDGKFQVLSMAGDRLSSVVVELPEETLNYLNGNIKENVLDRAQLTADQQVKESERQQIVDRLTSAVEYIEGQIGNISNLPASRVNYYAEGETQENVNNETLFSVLGPVLADGSFIRYDVRENGNLFETVIVVPNAEGKTEQQIYEAYFSGNYSLGASTEVDLDAEYTPPTPTDPDNPDPDNPGGGEEEETISFDEIYNQVFGEGFVVNTDINNILTDLAERVFINTTDVSVIAVGLNDGFTIYSQNVDALRRTRLTEGVYRGGNLEEITGYLSLLQQIENAGGWESYIYSFAPSSPVEEGSAAYTQLIETLQSIKDNIDNTDVISALTRSDFSTRTVINATTETLPASSNAFGEALMEDMGLEGTLISTYVGDIGFRQIDDTNIFTTGYYSIYAITIVFQQGEDIRIIQADILNEWNNVSTNDSQYQYLLDGNSSKYVARNVIESVVRNAVAQSFTATASSEAGLVIG